MSQVKVRPLSDVLGAEITGVDLNRLDDADFARSLPAGSTGDAAIFTDHVKVAHIIRRVLLRQLAILNYVNPF